MATAFATIPLAQHPSTMNNSTLPNHSHFASSHHHASPSSSASHHSPAALVLNSPQDYSSTPPGRKASYDAYLPTPQSGPTHSQHQPQQHPYLGKHTQDYAYSTPSPNNSSHQWQPQPVAGPSTYRRASHVASPISVSGSDFVTGKGAPSEHASPAKNRAKGRMTAMGEQVMMDGMERMVVDDTDGRIGVEEPYGERSYTELKCLGDGSFGTVWLCDWHSPVKSNVVLSAMQCGAGARPEWAGKRLVALKRMKRVWEGGWSQARNLGEIYSLSRIPQHEAIIPLYDAFISPKSRELYFVFECMEGNLYQLTKSRRGRPLAAGLIASCFHQISSGLHHIHRHGYFHRDMKPENLLVTTTGLAEYLTSAAVQHINASRTGTLPDMLVGADGRELAKYEKDVQVIVKLADFGLARATTSKPPYTEYVSTRWYRAPEVLLRSTEYGPPVDMWALGTILAEMLNLKPLFPGVSEIDQVYRITETLGDPSTDYGLDERGRTIGGGVWVSGIKLAKNVGFSFPKRKPVKFRSLFHENVPQSLIDCIADLLRYNPKHRMTSTECIQHAYFHETIPHLERTPPLPTIPFSQGQPRPQPIVKQAEQLVAPPRAVPPSHSHHETRPAFGNGDMRTLPPPVGTPTAADAGNRINFPSTTSVDRYGPSALVSQLRELDLPTEDLHSYGHRAGMSPGPPAASAAPSQGVYNLPPDPSTTSIDNRTRAWAEETGRRGSNAQSTMYDGSVYEGAGAAASTASFSQFNLSQNAQSSNNLSRVANFVQAQQQIQTYEDGTPRDPSQQRVPIPPPPIEPTPGASTISLSNNQSTSKLSILTSGKKKKWGLSSVFGGGDKHSSSSNLAPVQEVQYQGTSSSSLKRTQSGNTAFNANPAMASQMSIPPIDESKMSKKEVEKAKREAEKMKREAAARMQKERARAVMMKRQHMMSEAPGAIIENYSSGFSNEGQKNVKGKQPAGHQPSADGSYTVRDLGVMPTIPAGQSTASIMSHQTHQSESQRSQHSIHSHQSKSQPQLPSASQVPAEVASRHKARRRNEDDDHSMSSFDHGSLRSRSVLTIGTIDSDPGPRRGRNDHPDALPRTFSKDPLVARRHRQASPFHQAISQSNSKLASMSNPSLESQLAHDFMAHANVAGSNHSLGQLGQLGSSSSMNLAAGAPHQGSAPTSPYGHPVGSAVAHGNGMGRTGGDRVQLPSISQWEGQGGDINPMFVVPPAQEDHRHPEAAPGATLPPFSSIARVADSHSRQR